MTYAIEQRMRLIDFLLATYGYINRQALCDYFGISMPQASKDLTDYRAGAEGNCKYDGTARCYVRCDGFERVFP